MLIFLAYTTFSYNHAHVLVAASGTAVLYMSAAASLCKRQQNCQQPHITVIMRVSIHYHARQLDIHATCEGRGKHIT
jgi:fatty acid/phospholipid biosynthesis enzyme